MPEQPGAGRLEPETLAAYIDGLLPPEERARVDAEIAADPETFEWVVNTISAVDNPATAMPAGSALEVASNPVPSPWPRSAPPPSGDSREDRKVRPFYRRRNIQGLLGTMLATAAAVVLIVRTQPAWWQNVWGPSVDPRFAELVEAVGEERYIEARLTGGFKFGPLRQVMRGTGDLSGQNLRLMGIVDGASERVVAGATASDLHVAGVGSLLMGDADVAIDRLILALELAPRSISVRVDLAAALYTRYRMRGQRDDLERAELVLAAATGPEPVELLYNRALIRSALGGAGDVWTPFLARSNEPGWREEAERIRTLVERRPKP